MINELTCNIRLSEFPVYIQSLIAIRIASAKANFQLKKISKEALDALTNVAENIAKQEDYSEFDLPFINAVGPVVNRYITDTLKKRCEQNGVYIDTDTIELNQATMDVASTATELAIYESLDKLVHSAHVLRLALEKKAVTFDGVVKCGRISLQDSVPVLLRDEFHAHSIAIQRAIERIEQEKKSWIYSHLGVGDLGTGFGIHPDFGDLATIELSKIKERIILTDSEPLAGLNLSGKLLTTHASVESLAFTIWKIAHDFEFQASGPRGGIRELALPAVAPGSSIMPGKINPTVAEMAMAACNQVLSNRDMVIQGLHQSWTDPTPLTTLPIRALLQDTTLLSKTCEVFVKKVINGITANPEKTLNAAKQSLANGLILVPLLGKNIAYQVIEKASKENSTVQEAALSLGIISEPIAQEIFNPLNLASNQSMKALMKKYTH